jgi:hypothetical protein
MGYNIGGKRFRPTIDLCQTFKPTLAGMLVWLKRHFWVIYLLENHHDFSNGRSRENGVSGIGRSKAERSQNARLRQG